MCTSLRPGHSRIPKRENGPGWGRARTCGQKLPLPSSTSRAGRGGGLCFQAKCQAEGTGGCAGSFCSPSRRTPWPGVRSFVARGEVKGRSCSGPARWGRFHRRALSLQGRFHRHSFRAAPCVFAAGDQVRDSSFSGSPLRNFLEGRERKNHEKS